MFSKVVEVPFHLSHLCSENWKTRAGATACFEGNVLGFHGTFYCKV